MERNLKNSKNIFEINADFCVIIFFEKFLSQFILKKLRKEKN